MFDFASLGGVLLSIIHQFGGVLANIAHHVHTLIDTPIVKT